MSPPLKTIKTADPVMSFPSKTEGGGGGNPLWQRLGTPPVVAVAGRGPRGPCEKEAIEGNCCFEGRGVGIKQMLANGDRSHSFRTLVLQIFEKKSVTPFHRGGPYGGHPGWDGGRTEFSRPPPKFGDRRGDSDPTTPLGGQKLSRARAQGSGFTPLPVPELRVFNNCSFIFHSPAKGDFFCATVYVGNI